VKRWLIINLGIFFFSFSFFLFLRQQLAILADLVKDLPLEFDFLFSQSQAEVISGKQEGTERGGWAGWGRAGLGGAGRGGAGRGWAGRSWGSSAGVWDFSVHLKDWLGSAAWSFFCLFVLFFLRQGFSV
jgi:hypothetical protein